VNLSSASALLFVVVALLAGGCASDRSARSSADSLLPSDATDATDSTGQLSSFSLTDQRGETRRVEFPAELPLLLTLADRKGSREVEGWVEPVRTRFGETVRIEGVADLRAVPGFLRGFVRKQFSGLDYPVMLDWHGEVVEPAGYQGGAVDVLLVDRRGGIRWRARGEADEVGVGALLALLEELVDPGTQDLPGSAEVPGAGAW
jgi:hypothetical protein